ncbi:MAG: alpha/beta fold hydrolase [Hymenobacteraceae bacterium]|nr:alpha/beta fold hydrolase [Hymenobacteraceae bacterium]MDX5395764.1 alpha/beta fold hydrolase [Hymenobacteraceae bacterium]MDX5511819.1 alpha/beta fold hydrolase [Hymenobacteraceae bacterium]
MVKKLQQYAKRMLCLAAVSGLLAFGNGDELKRRAFLGVMVAPAAEGVQVQKVVPKSSGEAAGLQAQDIITQVNGKPVKDPGSFVQSVVGKKSGEKISITFLRDGKKQDKQITLQALPKEENPDFDIIYDQVSYGSNTVRSIISKPKSNGSFPAVLIVQGIGCYSIDNPLAPTDQYRKFVADLTNAGFVTMRVEKSGMGDSEGKPCNQCNFQDEVQNFSAALEKLKKLPYVDAKNVFIFGHSMGGMLAPVMAQQIPVKGIIAYGTAFRPWMEYELYNAEQQRKLNPAMAAATDVDKKFLQQYLVEKKAPQQIIKQNPELLPAAQSRHMQNDQLHGQHYTFIQQLSDVNLEQKWKKLNTYVLAVHGTSDFVSHPVDHELLAKAVNQVQAGKAKHVELQNADHWFNDVPSKEASLQNAMTGKVNSSYNEELSKLVTDWLQQIVKKKA